MNKEVVAAQQEGPTLEMKCFYAHTHLCGFQECKLNMLHVGSDNCKQESKLTIQKS